MDAPQAYIHILHCSKKLQYYAQSLSPPKKWRYDTIENFKNSVDRDNRGLAFFISTIDYPVRALSVAVGSLCFAPHYSVVDMGCMVVYVRMIGGVVSWLNDENDEA